MSDFKFVINDLFKILVAAQSERKLRQEWIDAENEPLWVLYERQVMLDAINDYRGMLGKPPVLIEPVLQAETWSSGHCDYTSKLSVHGAEIVFDCLRHPDLPRN